MKRSRILAVLAVTLTLVVGGVLAQSASAAKWKNRGSGSAQTTVVYKGDLWVDAASSKNPNKMRFSVTWNSSTGRAMPHDFSWSLSCRSKDFSGPSTYRSGRYQKRLSAGTTHTKTFDVARYEYCSLFISTGPRILGPDFAGSTKVVVQQQ